MKTQRLDMQQGADYVQLEVYNGKGVKVCTLSISTDDYAWSNIDVEIDPSTHNLEVRNYSDGRRNDAFWPSVNDPTKLEMVAINIDPVEE